MCGVVGIYTKDRSRTSLPLLKRMANQLSHRGPDGEGYFIEDNIALAHKRLAILDTSPRANQPMTSKSGRWTIVFNGCIYNFLSLKQDLRRHGHEFITTSDTEVIAEGLDRYGIEFFASLNGMFAIGAWDNKTKSLILSRDRFGVKPLYYRYTDDTLIFASEIKAILEYPKVKVEVDLNSLNEYFTFQNLFSYRTLFKGIFMLPPANTVVIDRNTSELKHNSWWDFDFTNTDENMTFHDAVEETKSLMKSAVEKQMISDVPVGSYLSGGMDSASVSSIASSHLERLTTFTCGFDMSEVTGIEANYDERREAELIANKLKTEHFEQVINAGDLRWSLKQLVYHLEDLKVGMSYPNYYIARLASKFVKVCLQGTGGDELFGGYPWRYYHVFDSLDQNDFFQQYYKFWQRLVPDEEKSKLFTQNISQSIDFTEPRKIFEKVFTFNPKLSYDTPENHINNSLYFEIKTFLPGLLLVGDKLSMAHGLEERFPFLDNELVAFAQKIPVEHKLGNLTRELKRIDENEPGHTKKTMSYKSFDDGKNVLRKAMASYIPQIIINSKKQGFSAPDESWYRGANAAFVKELLLNGKQISASYINPDYVKEKFEEHVNKRANNRLLIWSFMNFEMWCRNFL